MSSQDRPSEDTYTYESTYCMGWPLYAGDPPHDRVGGAIYIVGDSFMSGAAVGSALHFVKGLRAAASGDRVASAFRAARSNAPRVAGMFGGYTAAFITVDNAVSLARGKETDHWSLALASAATFSLHGMRRGGAPAAARWALIGLTGYSFYAGFGPVLDYMNKALDSKLQQTRMRRMINRGEQPPTGP
ncbi:hypothetical protein BS78_06G157800 [Paspalum vaginatum]|nr:hypothetical protein BS78_06G157800 [Paspalum vaginatum]